jgi:membrane-associated phospholipid phosphatase
MFLIFVINPNLLMMFSRFISGENSISQVFYGTFLGFWTVFITLWILKPVFIDHFIILFDP